MLAVFDRLGSILFIGCALIVGPILLLALWTHALALEMWHRVNRRRKENGRENQQPRGSTRFQPHCDPLDGRASLRERDDGDG